MSLNTPSEVTGRARLTVQSPPWASAPGHPASRPTWLSPAKPCCPSTFLASLVGLHRLWNLRTWVPGHSLPLSEYPDPSKPLSELSLSTCKMERQIFTFPLKTSEILSWKGTLSCHRQLSESVAFLLILHASLALRPPRNQSFSLTVPAW